MTAKDRADLAFGAKHGVDYVALSFVRSAGDVSEARAALEPLLEQAPSVGYRPFEAEVFLELAGLHRDEGRMAEAEEASTSITLACSVASGIVTQLRNRCR